MRIALALTALQLCSCSPTLESGEWGNIRYFGEIPGEVPMRLLPPVTDRDGNVYVAYGDRGRSDTEVWVGRSSGGWKNACKGHRGDFGIHGFIGQSDREAWLWTGDAVLHIWGESGTCHEVLNHDPVTGTTLHWEALAPWVRISPSRVTTVALVRATNEDENYITLLDLERELMTNLQPLQPMGLTDLVIIGTGADPVRNEALFVVSYVFEGATINEAILLDSDASILKRIPLDLDTSPESYGVVGFFQSTGGGAWAGVRESGSLILISPAGGYDTTPDFDAYGLLKTQQNLFVTGLLGNSAVAAKVSHNSELNGAREWKSPTNAYSSLSGQVSVFDERNSPLRKTTWTEAESAIGVLPLISAHPLDPYTLQSSGWLVAGPSYTGPAEEITSIGFAPIGWTSP